MAVCPYAFLNKKLHEIFILLYRVINAEITRFSTGIHVGLTREKRVLTSEYPMITRESRVEHA